ncbi:hypothetical protein PENTCL1PPCAC_4632, partial [Pristionchus entomophagus]
LLVVLFLLPVVLSLNCMHKALVDYIIYDERGVATSGGQNDMTMGVQKCDVAMDRCVIFAPMLVTEYMKLDVATKDLQYTNSIRGGNNKVSGSACMSQRDTDTIKAQKADICEGTSQPVTVSCYCTTDECTG